MSKLFAEIIEKTDISKSPKFVSIEVNSEKEAIQKLSDEEKKPNWSGLSYVKRIHKCYHDEKINKPCEVSNV